MVPADAEGGPDHRAAVAGLDPPRIEADLKAAACAATGLLRRLPHRAAIDL